MWLLASWDARAVVYTEWAAQQITGVNRLLLVVAIEKICPQLAQQPTQQAGYAAWVMWLSNNQEEPKQSKSFWGNSITARS